MADPSTCDDSQTRIVRDVIRKHRRDYYQHQIDLVKHSGRGRRRTPIRRSSKTPVQTQIRWSESAKSWNKITRRGRARNHRRYNKNADNKKGIRTVIRPDSNNNANTKTDSKPKAS